MKIGQVELNSECANCGKTFVSGPRPTPYCSNECNEIASTVRYVRGLLSTGRWNPATGSGDPDLDYAVRIRMAHAVSGGYDRPARKLGPDVRAAVLERDRGLCVLCGAKGAEIDHIEGSSDDLTNLRLLCTPCHQAVTEGHLRPIVPGSEQDLLRREILSRITAPSPLRQCDADTWSVVWRTWCAEHRSVGRS